MDWLLKPTHCEYGRHTQKQPTERANSHSTTNVILKSCGLSTVSHITPASPREWNHQHSQNEQMHFLHILLRNQDFYQFHRVSYTISTILLVSSSIFFASNKRKSHVRRRSCMFSRCTGQNGGEKHRVVIARESGAFAYDSAAQGMAALPFPFSSKETHCATNRPSPKQSPLTRCTSCQAPRPGSSRHLSSAPPSSPQECRGIPGFRSASAPPSSRA